MSKRISHSLLDPMIGPKLKSLYPILRIPRRFPPEGIILVGHLSAIIGAIGFAFSTQFWWAGLVAALGVIGNHTADCLDGTHARATGQCRNGGELLDHFTDPISLAYWIVGIGVAASNLPAAIVAIICLFAIAVLTNIKAKMIGEFTLEKFGPTEFKCSLALLGLLMTTTMLWLPALSGPAAMLSILVLAITGVIYTPILLVRAVAEVNRIGSPADTSEWVTTGSKPVTADPKRGEVEQLQSGLAH